VSPSRHRAGIIDYVELADDAARAAWQEYYPREIIDEHVELVWGVRCARGLIVIANVDFSYIRGHTVMVHGMPSLSCVFGSFLDMKRLAVKHLRTCLNKP